MSFETALWEKVFIEGCCDVAAFGLVYYDYMITLDREVSLVWGQRFTAASALFVLNRYVALLKYPIYIAAMSQLTDQSCRAVNTVAQTLEVIPYFIWLLFTSLRTYAVCGRAWKAALLVGLTALMPVGTNIYLYSQTYALNYPLPIGCVWTTDMPMHIYMSLLISTRTSVIVTDVLVLVLTWWRTYGLRKVIVEANIKTSLASLLVRDGTIYFLIVLALNTFHIAFSLTERFTYTIVFEEAFTTILISRFLLNLREVDQRSKTNGFAMSYPSFVRPTDEPSGSIDFISPIGAPLAHGAPNILSDYGHYFPNSEYESDGSSATTGYDQSTIIRLSDHIEEVLV